MKDLILYVAFIFVGVALCNIILHDSSASDSEIRLEREVDSIRHQHKLAMSQIALLEAILDSLEIQDTVYIERIDTIKMKSDEKELAIINDSADITFKLLPSAIDTISFP